jgi:uncharacterized protein with von Willebrand factor type A (vWA) domain
MSESRLADNLLLFCRTLRQAGLPVGPGQVIEATRAVLETGIDRRDDFRVALRSVLVTDIGQQRLFDQAFHIYFRNPRLLERMMGLLLPTLEQEAPPPEPDKAIRRLMEAMADDSKAESDEVIVEIEREGTFSRREVLQHKDFEQMSLEEQAEAREFLRHGVEFLRELPTRRFRPSSAGRRYDLRRSMQLMARSNGQLIQLARKKPRTRPPTVVLIADISGSMTRYSRMFLHFAHALGLRSHAVHAFVFGTRLTNITRWLADHDVDRAMHKVSAEVADWDGGTRIADCLERFNVDWARRVLTGRSVVVLLTDGLERDSVSDLAFQARRLQRSTSELVWLNPMLRYDRFEPKAQGIRAMLPCVDHFLPAHNVASLLDLASLLESRYSRTARFAA